MEPTRTLRSTHAATTTPSLTTSCNAIPNTRALRSAASTVDPSPTDTTLLPPARPRRATTGTALPAVESPTARAAQPSATRTRPQPRLVPKGAANPAQSDGSAPKGAKAATKKISAQRVVKVTADATGGTPESYVSSLPAFPASPDLTYAQPFEEQGGLTGTFGRQRSRSHQRLCGSVSNSQALSKSPH